MATGVGDNPNEIPMNGDEDLQVMSPTGAQTSQDRPVRQQAVPNGIAPPPLRGQDLDGETVMATGLGPATDDMRPIQASSQPAEVVPGSTETELPSSSRAAISSASARGFLMGPHATPPKAVNALGTETKGFLFGWSG